MKLAIFGAGGHAKVVAEAALSSGWEDVDFYDDLVVSTPLAGRKVVGTFDELKNRVRLYDGVVIGIGANEVRS